MDLNGDGQINKEELMISYKQFFGRNLTLEQVDDIFLKVDADGNGVIDYSEFLIAALDEVNLLSKSRL